MQQLDLFAGLRSPAILMPVIADGEVIQGDIDEILRLPHKRLAWDTATIELHQHTDGRWMWSTGWNLDWQGSGYRVGPKWGKFAETRDDALHYAKEELLRSVSDLDGAKAIVAWAEALH